MIETRTYGRTVNVEIEMYDECKYTCSAEIFENSKVVKYEGLVNWNIVSGDEAKVLEEMINCIDDHHEYLVLNFENGTSATFRNSYVDMFRVK